MIPATRKRTIRIYTEALRELIEFIDNNQYKTTPLSQWITQKEITAAFIPACQKLNYISYNMGNKANPIFETNLSAKNVTSSHGKAIAKQTYEMIMEVRYKGKQPPATPPPKETSKIDTPQKLSQFSVDAIIEELRRRGYHGTVEKKDMHVTRTITFIE